jgi:hypothetical protein
VQSLARAWRRHQPDLPGRPEAIRRLIDAGLDALEQIPTPKAAKT